jgi:prepilin-type N-terminal cleavage/methylation domain-containing protein
MIAVNRHRLAFRKRVGMTLLELVIVIAILGIIAGFIIPGGAYLEKRAKYTATNASLATIRDAIVGTSDKPGYLTDTGQMPVTLRDLFVNPFPSTSALYTYNRDTGLGWRGPYLLNANGQYAINTTTNFVGGTYPAPYGANGDPTIIDAWGNAIILQIPTTGSTANNQLFARLVSAGPNGTIDTPIDDTAASPEYYPPPGDRGDDVVLFINHSDSNP